MATISVETPLLALALLAMAVLPVAACLGWWTGRRTHFARGYDNLAPRSFPGEASMGAILALLGLLLAFTFNYSLTRAEEHKFSQLEEAAALGTAFLRADHLAEPGRSNLQEALYTYASTRIADASLLQPGGINEFMERTTAAQGRLWPTIIDAMRPDTPPAIISLVSSGITEVLDAHTRRLIAALDTVPAVAKAMLFICAGAALFLVGNNAGLRGRPLTWRVLILSGVVAFVMIVILDFERPHEGFIRLDTRVMQVAINEMAVALGKEPVALR